MATTPSSSALQLCILGDDENIAAFSKRLTSAPAGAIAFLGMRERTIAETPEHLSVLIKALEESKSYIATKHAGIAKHARAKGVRVIDRTSDLKDMLDGHPQLPDALRMFAPHVWRQQLKSRLQRMGLVTMPRLRIYSLVALSGLLFFFVIFRLLPSAEVIVRPRRETVTQTVNVFLVQSGARLPASRVRMLPLTPIVVREQRTLTFDQISKEFIGTAAVMDFEITNTAAESMSLKQGTRLQNQAGVVFRTIASVVIPAGSKETMRAKADPIDAFDQMVGERGNVPAGVVWEVPGLDAADRALVKAVNTTAGTGGTTKYRTVLTVEDLDTAKKRLEQELLATAKRMVDEEIEILNAEYPERGTQLLRYGELTKLSFTGFVVPTQFLGQEVSSVPVEGSIVYIAHAYDALSILTLLKQELESHVREGKRLLTDGITDQNLVAHVIDYEDDLSWIKLTVDLSATEEYVLDPLTKDGAIFAKRVRDSVVGLTIDEALRIIRNMPEVETADISMWPPWNRRLPQIPAHISISRDE